MAKILLVDDYEQLARVLKAFLTHESHDVTVTENGAAAWQRVEAGEDFDLVISDLWMPEMGGVELIQRLRERLPNLKILAISGAKGGSAANRLQDAAHAGADLTLAKPFGRQDVLDAIAKILPAEPFRPPPPSATRAPFPPAN